MKKDVIIIIVIIIIVIIVSFNKNISGFAAKVISSPESKEKSMSAFNYVNKLRAGYNRSIVLWDDKVYNLSLERAKNMFNRSYFDHIDPDKKCINDIKVNYGFNLSDIIIENIGSLSHYYNGEPAIISSIRKIVDSWMLSRGHRYTLLYPEITRGAIGCYKYICIFYGVYKNNGAKIKCVSGNESLAFWKNAGKQPGEI